MEFSKHCLWDFCFCEVFCCQDTQGEDVKRRHIERTSYSEYPRISPLHTNHSDLPYAASDCYRKDTRQSPQFLNNKLSREQKTCIINSLLFPFFLLFFFNVALKPLESNSGIPLMQVGRWKRNKFLYWQLQKEFKIQWKGKRKEERN